MSLLIKSIPAVFALALAAPHSHSAELSETQKESLINRLEELLGQRQSGAANGAKGAIAKLKAAAASDAAALDLYLDCVKQVRFERDEKKAAEFAAWKDRHNDAHGQDVVGTCLRAHALGLAVALQVSEIDRSSDTPDEKEAAFLRIVPEFHTFVDLAYSGIAQLDALRADPENNRYHEDANAIAQLEFFNSNIAEALQVTVFSRPPENFPTKLDGTLSAMETFLLPRLYEIGKYPPIEEAWEKHVERLVSNVNYYKKEKLIAKSKDVFEKDLPRARWDQARDSYTFGTDKVAGATAMLEVIKSHLDHELCVAWIEEFRNIVEAPPASPEPGETASL